MQKLERNGPPPEDTAKTGLTSDELVRRYLVDHNLIRTEDLDRAARAAVKSAASLCDTLVKLGLTSEQDLARAFADVFDIPITALSEYPDAPFLAELLPPDFVRSTRVMPLRGGDAEICLAMVDPTDAATVASVSLKSRLEVKPQAALLSEFENAVERLYPILEQGEPSPGAGPVDAQLDQDLFSADVQRLQDLASEAPVVQFTERIIEQAAASKASDIHLEPYENRLQVRFRIDGVLVEQPPPPAGLSKAITARIKVLANLNIAEQRTPQDGRLLSIVRGRPIDIRVSILPSLHGEAAVLRLLDQSSVSLDLAELGYSEEELSRFGDFLNRPNGIVLVCGPTGSGKTTTLYAALKQLKSAERKIITVEDPVEFKLDGITQIQTNAKAGLDFGNVLRSVLRHDPDIIMIGEIRDVETAKIAVQAALTGHIVLATVHTNSAAAAITRLVDMGVEGFLIRSTLIGVVAQRLVRVLCPQCANTKAVSESPKTDKDAGEAQAAHRTGDCPTCSGTGYRGRTTISELLPVSGEVRRLIGRSADASTIEQTAVEEGMTTLKAAARLKIEQGVTDASEIGRVLSESS